MRIAFFTDNYLPQPSGVATSVDYFARFLRKSGHTVYIFAPKTKEFTGKEDNVFRLPSVRLMPSLPDGARLPLPIISKNFWKMVEFDFDIIHAHGNGAFSLLGMVVAKAKKVPFVSTFHIQVDQFAHYFLKGRFIKPKLMNKILLKKFGNLCDGVIAPSKKMGDQLIELGLKKKMCVIPNFIDIDKFKVKKVGLLHKICHIPKHDSILLSVGRIGKEKNFEFLVRAFEKVSVLNSKVHLVIVGPDWGEVKRLKKLSKQLGIESRLKFIGKIKAEDMPKVYADADIFVFASKSEVHPMVAIEAAASSLPLIVIKDSAYKGLVINNKNGFMVTEDKEVFAKALLTLLNNPKLLKKFKTNSLNLVKSKFGPEILINKTLLFYGQTIKDYQQLKLLKASRTDQTTKTIFGSF